MASKAVMMTADQATADSTVEKVEIAADLKAVAITAIRVAADSIAETVITIQVEIDILRRKENLINAILTPREKSQQLPQEQKESALKPKKHNLDLDTKEAIKNSKKRVTA